MVRRVLDGVVLLAVVVILMAVASAASAAPIPSICAIRSATGLQKAAHRRRAIAVNDNQLIRSAWCARRPLSARMVSRW